ncbi:response regulator transcription factor [Actinocrispum wychmicini]|uniref:Regulatory LuxR family protein n=1 Tax=Actinocrispum wychmicini TaxID=1213861 RepID=A0A4R2JZU5_9PSEU|nr:helix-turn-helix transcriptional regulator [Actinocrispum wychmicini]TCO62839.1 regulatory LuxR family protein [Actinocrispum wychmicini]
MPTSSALMPTDREIQVVRLVAAGLSNAQIGERLWISERTAKQHVSNLRRKLRARDRAHLVSLCYQAGWLRVDCP